MWCDEEALSFVFPSLFTLAAQKDVMVADLWDCSREEGRWSLIFLRSLNDWELEEVERFLLTMQRQKFNPMSEDKLLLKGVGDGGFSVKRMYMDLDLSPDVVFPFHSIWNSVVPSKIGFFAWEAS